MVQIMDIFKPRKFPERTEVPKQKKEFDISRPTIVEISPAYNNPELLETLASWFDGRKKSLGEVTAWMQYDTTHGFYQTHVPMSTFRVGEDGLLVDNEKKVFVTFAGSPLLAHLLGSDIRQLWEQKRQRLNIEVAGDGAGILTENVLG